MFISLSNYGLYHEKWRHHLTSLVTKHWLKLPALYRLKNRQVFSLTHNSERLSTERIYAYKEGIIRRRFNFKTRVKKFSVLKKFFEKPRKQSEFIIKNPCTYDI